MKSISLQLVSEQKKSSRSPVVSAVSRQYGHPSKADNVQWGMFGWEKLHSDAQTPKNHGVAMPSDGSLIRIRVGGAGVNTRLYYQRIASPDSGSAFGTWSNYWLMNYADDAVGIGAYGTKVLVAHTYVGGGNDNIHLSSDSGATWADSSTTQILHWSI